MSMKVAGKAINKKDGQGILTLPNGNVYEGEWRDGKKHGQSKHTYPSGAIHEGWWDEGVRFA